MAETKNSYPANLDIDYPGKLDRLTSFARVLWAIPILILLTVLTSAGQASYMHETSKTAAQSGGDVLAGLSIATGLMIVFRQRYPRWWYDFALELNRFSARVWAYLFLLTDVYPSTVDKQSVHLDYVYPNVEKDLNRWLPLVKWFLVIPHYIVLFFLVITAGLATIIAWFAILFTGEYPRSLFDFVVGVARWATRVNAYAFMLITDEYPPFSLSK
jgi:hypothetical protein